MLTGLLAAIFAALLALSSFRLWQATQYGSDETIQRGWIAVAFSLSCLVVVLSVAAFRRRSGD
jgi:hypothetical protein